MIDSIGAQLNLLRRTRERTGSRPIRASSEAAADSDQSTRDPAGAITPVRSGAGQGAPGLSSAPLREGPGGSLLDIVF